MVQRNRIISISNIIGFYIVIFLLLACEPVLKSGENSKSATIDLEKNNTILLPKSEAILLDDHLLKEIAIKNNFEWFDYFSLFKVNGFRHYDSNSFVRFSKNRKYRLVYDLVKKENKVYNEQWDLLANYKVEAHNPEFYIITLPLEEEAGIILFDGLKGIKKFGVDKSKDYEIPFNEFYPRLSNIYSDKNQFEILETCNELAHKGIRKQYAFDDGALIDSIGEDCGNIYNGYIDDLNLLIRGNRDSIQIYSSVDENFNFYLPHRYHPESFKIFEQAKSYTTGLVTPEALYFYIVNKDGLSFKSYIHKYDENQYSTSPFAFDKVIGYTNFSLSTLDDSTQKLTDSSISFYNINSNKSYKIAHKNNEGILSCTIKEEQLICMDLNKVYSMPIAELSEKFK